jgi:hypothetical protein
VCGARRECRIHDIPGRQSIIAFRFEQVKHKRTELLSGAHHQRTGGRLDARDLEAPRHRRFPMPLERAFRLVHAVDREPLYSHGNGRRQLLDLDAVPRQLLRNRTMHATPGKHQVRLGDAPGAGCREHAIVGHPDRLRHVFDHGDHRSTRSRVHSFLDGADENVHRRWQRPHLESDTSLARQPAAGPIRIDSRQQRAYVRSVGDDVAHGCLDEGLGRLHAAREIEIAVRFRQDRNPVAQSGIVVPEARPVIEGPPGTRPVLVIEVAVIVRAK